MTPLTIKEQITLTTHRLICRMSDREYARWITKGVVPKKSEGLFAKIQELEKQLKSAT